jgi:hypothetical protein
MLHFEDIRIQGFDVLEQDDYVVEIIILGEVGLHVGHFI